MYDFNVEMENDARFKKSDCKIIFLVTDDIFLFTGLKTFIPEVILLQPSNMFTDMQFFTRLFSLIDYGYAVMFDNRVSFKEFKWFMSSFFNTDKCISSVLINMKREGCAQMHVGEAPKINSFNPRTFIKQIKENIILGSRINYGRAMIKYKLNLTEAYIIQSMVNGIKNDLIARSLGVNQKKIYDYRFKLSFKFGFRNFNETCIFIFRNEILDSIKLLK